MKQTPQYGLGLAKYSVPLRYQGKTLKESREQQDRDLARLSERQRRRAELFGDPQRPPEGPSRAERRQALIEEHRASEHLFKPSEESHHGGEGGFYSGRAPNEVHVIRTFEEHYNRGVGNGLTPAEAHEQAARATERATITPHGQVLKLAEEAGSGKHQVVHGPTREQFRGEKELAPMSAKGFHAFKERASGWGQASVARRQEVLRDAMPHLASSEINKWSRVGNFSSLPLSISNNPRVLAHAGLGGPEIPKRLKDPQKEQLARLKQAKTEKAIQVGPRGGKHILLPGGGKRYIK